ncbi:MAG: NfeD family protein [Actinomycetota bacterium]|nr:NfeD family protein [Actinomycetota bacterium]
MPHWALWLVAASVLVVGEIMTTGLFFLGPVALAALVAAGVAAAGGGITVQLLAFLVGSVASLALLRPIARRHLRAPAAIRTGTAALAGGDAVVVERVDANGGRVKIAGEVWSARAYFDDQVLEPGARAEVVKIEGATALVHE